MVIGKRSLGVRGHVRRGADAIHRVARDNRLLRSTLIPLLATRCHVPKEPEWLVCSMYHDLLPAQQGQFAVQLRYMQSFGDIIGIDDAVLLLEKRKLGGRYFCITFDDGYWGAYRYASPVLAEARLPAAFFVVPTWMDSMSNNANPSRTYMNWEECRALSSQGFVVGSHSQAHARLSSLRREAAVFEMAASRERITKEVGAACDHFACPWGQPGEDYVTERDPGQAQALGYRSFFTTISARASNRTSPFSIPRIRVEPSWGKYQLKYMFFR